LARQAALATEAAPVVPMESGLQAKLLAAASLDRWMAASDDVARLFSRSDAVNLDRKQTVIGSFLALQSATR
ncbi:MAG: dnaX 1, partial [Reyranella sp.]|nr:dnaX 1 [Reyranella sp.]